MSQKFFIKHQMLIKYLFLSVYPELKLTIKRQISWIHSYTSSQTKDEIPPRINEGIGSDRKIAISVYLFIRWTRVKISIFNRFRPSYIVHIRQAEKT